MLLFLRRAVSCEVSWVGRSDPQSNLTSQSSEGAVMVETPVMPMFGHPISQFFGIPTIAKRFTRSGDRSCHGDEAPAFQLSDLLRREPLDVGQVEKPRLIGLQLFECVLQLDPEIDEFIWARSRGTRHRRLRSKRCRPVSRSIATQELVANASLEPAVEFGNPVFGNQLLDDRRVPDSIQHARSTVFKIVQ